MRKRFWSILLTLCMALGLLPQTALAADKPWVDNPSAWTKLTASNTTLSGGNYYLDNNLEISSTIEITGTVTLDLNGHVLQMTASDKSVIKITSTGNLTLQDSNSSAEHKFDTKKTSWWLLDEEDGDETVSGGVITGGNADDGGGVYNSGTFTMNGGNISGNSVGIAGGGVYNTGTFTMKAGNITGNSAPSTGGRSGNGGGVYNSGTFTMSSGNISGNSSDDSGGGVNNADTFTMKGGNIGGNYAQRNGGGVNNSGTFTMENGSNISGNSAGGGGGGVYNDSDFTMNDGSISDNSAGVGSGVSNEGTFTMNGGSISDNFSGDHGGVFNTNTFNADGGEVEDAVLNNASGTITTRTSATGTTEFYGKVKNEGTISGGKFTGNVTNESGATISGGVFDNIRNESGAIISGGEFIGYEVFNSGTISNGIFSCVVRNEGTISGGDFTGAKITNNGTISPSAQVTITFNLNGATGTAPAAQAILKGQKATEPTDPTRSGFTFGGWYKEADCTTAFDFDTAITGNITLYAKWIVNMYTVTFDANGGTVMPSNITLNEHCKPDTLPTPARSGYTFDGWYTAATGGKKVDTDTVFSANTTIYAHWTAIPSAPSGSSSGGSSSPSYAASVSAAENGTVKVSPKNARKGDTVTITVTPDAGYALENLTVLDKNGDSIGLTDKGNGKFTFKMPNGKVTIDADFAEESPAEIPEEEAPIEEIPETPADKIPVQNPFADVSEKDYFYQAVLWALENGITGGVDAEHFAPHESCSRGQIASFLYRYAKAQGEGFTDAWMMRLSFTDVPEWCSEAVLWCNMKGIVSGYGNGLFGSNDPITREQLAVILYRFAQAMGMDTTQGGMAVREYSDYSDISDYAVAAVQWAVSAGIMSGADGKLMPNEPCSRAQIVAMLYRFDAVGSLA